MLIIGCDYHPGFQQIAFVDTETGEFGERRLTHREEAEQFYGALTERSVRVGMEASGHARWFERLLRDLEREPRPKTTVDSLAAAFPPERAHRLALPVVGDARAGSRVSVRHSRGRHRCREY